MTEENRELEELRRRGYNNRDHYFRCLAIQHCMTLDKVYDIARKIGGRDILDRLPVMLHTINNPMCPDCE